MRLIINGCHLLATALALPAIRRAAAAEAKTLRLAFEKGKPVLMAAKGPDTEHRRGVKPTPVPVRLRAPLRRVCRPCLYRPRRTASRQALEIPLCLAFLSALIRSLRPRIPVNSLASSVPSLSLSSVSNFAIAAFFASSKLTEPSWSVSIFDITELWSCLRRVGGHEAAGHHEPKNRG